MKQKKMTAKERDAQYRREFEEWAKRQRLLIQNARMILDYVKK